MSLFHIGLRRAGTKLLHIQEKQTTGWSGPALGNILGWESGPWSPSPLPPGSLNNRTPLLIFYPKAASWNLGPQTHDFTRVQGPGMWTKGGVTWLWRKESLGQGGEQML